MKIQSTQTIPGQPVVLDYGMVKITLAAGEPIKMDIHHADRLANKQIVADIETVLHRYIGEFINDVTIFNLDLELKALTANLVYVDSIRPVDTSVEK